MLVKSFRSGQREVNFRVELLERLDDISLEVKGVDTSEGRNSCNKSFHLFV